MTLDISSSVGRRGTNRRADVERLQLALTEAAALTLDPRLHPGPPDGLSGDGTEGAVSRLQRRIGIRNPDGRVDPNGYTARRLSALLAIGAADMSFPFAQSSAHPYHGPGSGMRAFGAWRSGGKRAHAGVDLYFPDLTPVLSVANGRVVRDPYPFYYRTWAVEVDHGAFVFRYGELDRASVAHLRAGDPLAKGQRLGAVGVLVKPNGKRLGVPSMMLHGEMYDKTETGALTRAKGTSARHTNGAYFYRRRDLIDPTGFLVRAPLPR
jgi:murein DD-endopeptidase MepM/ murein hydrolase activator NlpD